ncbi:MAG TPA: nucleotidyltransferase family protein, partial [Candidatus Baltobacteraceae bacterium]|nr:nucleotidyltransferase family protein [Candidatus Baltobacteraceae bacterium]
AGGFGTRIKHLLGDLPKPMAPVNGKPFIEWIVRYLSAQGIRNVILSTGYMAETIEKHFQSQPVKNARVTCIPETHPLGTAGGFLNAIGPAKENPQAWLVFNGDSLAPAPLKELSQSLDDPKISGAILGVRVPDASRFGTILQNERGELAGFNEKKPGAGVINAGIYLFRTSAIESFPDKIPLSFETDVFPALIAEGVRLKVCVTDAPFLDIGTPESLPQAEDFIRRNAACFQIES